MPVWFVATHKEEQQNYVKATEAFHRALKGIPCDMKKYGKNTLVKVKKIQFKVSYCKVTV